MSQASGSGGATDPRDPVTTISKQSKSHNGYICSKAWASFWSRLTERWTRACMSVVMIKAQHYRAVVFLMPHRATTWFAQRLMIRW